MAAVIETWTDPLLMLVVTPLLGAALGLLLWSKPRLLMVWVLLVTLASLVMLMGVSGGLTGPAAGIPFLSLLPLAAFLSILGQPVQQEGRVAWLMTLLLLGLGLGVLISQNGLKLILLVNVFGLVSLLIGRYKKLSGPQLWWAIGMYSLGVACLMGSLITAPPVSSIALLLTYSVLLPLFPFHGGYVGALVGLPGNLPAFLALLLPSIGFHGVLTLIPSMPGGIVQTLVILALLGALYGSLKALAQYRVVSLLAYAGLAFFAILWWYLATTKTYSSHAVIYLSAVALVTGGLLLAWRAVQARYGDVDLRAISGLAHPMPRFATLLSLLALAAMGLPPFGVFSGFMGMLLTPSLPLSGALLIIVVAWLTASWYLLNLMQQLLFGRHRRDLRYEDLRQTEFASLLMFVLILMALGIVPSRFFESGTPSHGYSTAMESKLWHK